MKHDFKIDIEMTATINSAISIKMIEEAVEKQTGKKVHKITPTHEGGTFTGFHVVFDPNAIVKKSFKPSKEFIINNFDEN